MPIIQLVEAERYSGIPADTLKKYCQRGILKGVKVPKKPGGTFMVWAVDTDVLNEYLGKQGEITYTTLYNGWKVAMLNGTLTGKPMGKGAKANIWSLDKYWERMGLQPDIKEINGKRLREFYGMWEPNHAERQCFYATKDHTRKALLSFTKYLVLEGLKMPADVDDLKAVPLKRLYPPKKTVLPTEKSIQTLLSFNESWRHGRGYFDYVLTHTLLHMMIFGGFRSEEAARFKLEHIDWDNGIITIYGKNNKIRQVGLWPELRQQLEIWLPTRAEIVEKTGTKATNVVLQAKGVPITYNALYLRIKRLAKAAGISITPHGLRRSCATFLENKGMPWSMIKAILGHADIKTTQSYVMTDERKAVEYMVRGGAPLVEEVKKAEEAQAMPNPWRYV